METDDICDELAGKSPKEFVWLGWHPQCMCYQVPVFKTDDELWEWKGEISNTTKSVNEVTDVPQNFTNWIAKNEVRLQNATIRNTLPYFVRDNANWLPSQGTTNIFESNIKQFTLESNDARIGMFGRKNNRYDISQESSISDIPIFEMSLQRENTELFLKKLGYSEKAIKSIHPMPFLEADMGKANFANDINNCQLCAPTLLARMRGINISAPFYQSGGFMEYLSNNMCLAFENSEKLKITSFQAKEHHSIMKMQNKLQKAIEHLPNNSIHHFGYDKLVNGEEGHIWTIIKSNEQLYIVDGQEKRGKNHSLKSILPRINFLKKVELMRVDNLGFSDEFMNFFAKPHKREELRL